MTSLWVYDILVSRVLLPEGDQRVLWAMRIPALRPASAVFVLQDDEGPDGVVVARRPKGDLARHVHRRLPPKAGRLPNLGPDILAGHLVKTNSRIVEKRAALDAETVNGLAKVWRAALLRVRYPTDPGSGIMDGVSYHFGQTAYLTGEANSPADGTVAGDLASISDELMHFAEAEPSERDSVKASIRVHCQKLLERLDRLGGALPQPHPTNVGSGK
jgi:hypothetical protein